MNTVQHMALGACMGALPDAALSLFAWSPSWVPESDWRVRLHRALHTWRGVLVVVALAYTSHLIADRYSKHNTEATWHA